MEAGKLQGTRHRCSRQLLGQAQLVATNGERTCEGQHMIKGITCVSASSAPSALLRRQCASTLQAWASEHILVLQPAANDRCTYMKCVAMSFCSHTSCCTPLHWQRAKSTHSSCATQGAGQREQASARLGASQHTPLSALASLPGQGEPCLQASHPLEAASPVVADHEQQRAGRLGQLLEADGDL